MRTFNMIRECRSTLIIELSFWDMVRLILGRELKNNRTVIRLQPNYDALNLNATRFDHEQK